MQKVLQFLIGRINFICFLLLEIVCFILIYSNNPYQGAAFFNSSNSFTSYWIDVAQSFREYIDLKETNRSLAEENAHLRFVLTRKELAIDASYNPVYDTVYTSKYEYVAAKVVNNSTSNFRNYLTINKGWADSIAPGMGVICHSGIVGKVKSCSKNFATVTSLLHKEMMVSSKIKRSNVVGPVKWNGIDPTHTSLLYVSRHIQVKKGDTIVTSQFNSVFPEGEMIGIIDDIRIRGNESFYNIDLKLSTDFSNLGYVYVIKNNLKIEQDSLEAFTEKEKNEDK